MEKITRDLPEGYQFTPIMRQMTRERMTVYSDMYNSSCAGHFQLAPPSIHSDPELARSEGFPNVVADGLIVTCWIESIVRELFGANFFRGGKTMTKFIKPVYAGDEVTINLTVKQKTVEGDRVRIQLEINCVNQKGDVVTVGTTSAPVG